MFEIQVSDGELKEFQKIIDAYKDITRFPIPNKWMKLSNNDLWLHHIGQVMVVGGAVSKDKFDGSRELKEALSFDALIKIKNEDRLIQKINTVLRAAGVRYAGKDYSTCAKSKAIAHNYAFFISYTNYLKGIMEDLYQYEGDAEIERVKFLMKHLKFIKSKSARDFLMGLGMNRKTLALDVRIQNIFEHLKIAFPGPAELGKWKLYDDVEKQIIVKICDPLQIEPVILDRILFQNYSKILKKDYLIGNLFKSLK